MFADTTGLRAGDQVRVSGVAVGRVSGVKMIDANSVRITFTANRNQQITDKTHAVIRYANLIGARYLALSQPDGAGADVHDRDDVRGGDGPRVRPGAEADHEVAAVAGEVG